MSGTVYIVHCVDTEGPLFEEKKVPFEQIKKIFGISIEPTEKNLLMLQNGEINLNGKEKVVQELIDKHRITTRGSWEDIQNVLNVVTSKEFREKFKDSNGNGWIYNWFCMDHVGFTGDNPRRRDTGHHKIFDYYRKMVSEQSYGDFIGFHHHPVSFSGNYNDSGTAFWGTGNLNQILCRKIIDRKWFPVAFRPGFHTERPDSNWFLEQWIPFDYGNQATDKEETGQEDLSFGRFGDWRHAPTDWIPYHPSHDDYQANGTCRRWITRCLNMYARIRQIDIDDIRKAFQLACENKNVILAFTNHDYKDMYYEINRVRDFIKQVSNEYKNINFEYVDAIQAMRKCLDLKYEEIGLDAKLIKTSERNQLIVNVHNDIFGPQPYLAIKTKQGRYFWDNFDFVINGEIWSYTFDSNTVFLDNIETIGIAANNSCGECEVVLLDENANTKKYKYNISNKNKY